MKPHLLWEVNPGEHRLALIENGQPAEFRILRTVGAFASTFSGDIRVARIVENFGPRKALVRFADDVEAFLEPAPKLPEGARLAVEITRPPIAEPGRWKRAICKPRQDISIADLDAHRTSLASAMVQAWGAEAIIVSNQVAYASLREMLGDAEIAVTIEPAAFDAVDFDELEQIAVSGEYAIENGQISIERTRAMTMIDIDGSGDPVALNLVAANEIPRLLRLLDIGGQVGIDFLAMPDRSTRLSVDAALAEACKALGPHERTAINGFGFAQIVRPRPGPSIPEVLCGITPGRLSLESRAIALLREAAHSKGHGQRQLVANPAIIDLLRSWPDEVAALQKQLGAAIELVPDSSVSGYGHVHVSQS
ncbi:MAG: ribonuclease E/G [Sphingorhabdus sp.]|uniref:ribonuclease E/G n=1 Tax=Sphingorhabdus sp. TaxID=1902408 RepID=UPI003C98DA65